jgi:hypothetical protein
LNGVEYTRKQQDDNWRMHRWTESAVQAHKTYRQVHKCQNWHLTMPLAAALVDRQYIIIITEHKYQKQNPTSLREEQLPLVNKTIKCEGTRDYAECNQTDPRNCKYNNAKLTT